MGVGVHISLSSSSKYENCPEDCVVINSIGVIPLLGLIMINVSRWNLGILRCCGRDVMCVICGNIRDTAIYTFIIQKSTNSEVIGTNLMANIRNETYEL